LFVGAKKNVSTIYAGWQDPEQTNKVSSKRNGFSQRNLRQCFSLDFVGEARGLVSISLSISSWLGALS